MAFLEIARDYNLLFQFYSRIGLLILLVAFCFGRNRGYRNKWIIQIESILPPFELLKGNYLGQITVIITVIITFEIISSILVWYVVWFFVVTFICFIRYYCRIKKGQRKSTSETISPEVGYFDNWFLPYLEFAKFLLYYNIRGFAFLLNYRRLSRDQIQKKEIYEILKRRCLGSSFGMPFWVLKFLLYFTTYIIEIINDTNWSKKTYIAWPFIYLYELNSNFGFFLISYWKDYFMYIKFKRIILTEGEVRINTLSTKAMGRILASTFKEQELNERLICTSVKPKHQTNPITGSDSWTKGSIYYKSDNLTLTDNYTSKEFIKVDKERIRAKQVNKSTLIFGDDNQTPTKKENELSKQFSIKSVERMGDIEKGTITNFLENNNLRNPFQELLFQKVHWIRNIFWISKLKDETMLLDQSQYKNFAKKEISSWGDLKKKNFDYSTLQYIDETGPACLENFEKIIITVATEGKIFDPNEIESLKRDVIKKASLLSMPELAEILIATLRQESILSPEKINYIETMLTDETNRPY